MSGRAIDVDGGVRGVGEGTGRDSIPVARRAPQWIGPVIALCAIASHCWTLRLPFQLDDFFLIPRTGAMLRVGDWPAFDDAEMDATHRDSPDNQEHRPENLFLFRPTTWVTWFILVKLSGGIANPMVFHAVMLLIHGASAWLLYLILRDSVGLKGAALGAAVFALSHGSAQAVSWAAAQGDQFAVFFMLIAARGMQRHLVAGSKVAALATAAGVGLMLGSKETGAAMIPAFLLVALPSLLARRYWPVLRVLGLCVLAALVMLIVRRLTIGTWQPATTRPIVLRRDVLTGFKEIFLHVILPWNRAAPFADLPPLLGRITAAVAGAKSVLAANIFAIVAVALPCAIGLVLGTKRDRLITLVVFAAFLAVLVPPFALVPEPDTNFISRAMLPGVCLLGALLAAATQPFLRSRHRLLAFIVLAPLAWLTVDMAVHIVRTEMRAGRAIHGRLDVIDELTRANPDAWIISVDDQEYLGSIPMLSMFTASAFKPPFVDPPRRVSWRHHLDHVDKLPGIRWFPGAIMVCELEGERLALKHVSPALDRPLPPLRRGTTEGTFELERPVPARAIDAVRLTLARTPGTQQPITLTWLCSPSDRRRSLLPIGVKPTELTVDAPAGSEWVLAPALTGIRIEGAKVIGIPTPIDRLPDIPIRSPRAGEEYPFGSRLPVVFKPVPEAAGYRTYLWLGVGPTGGVTARYKSALTALRRHDDGWLEFSPSPESLLEGIDGPRGVEMSEAEFHQIVATIGQSVFTVGVRVHALAEGSETTIGRSPWAFARMSTIKK